MNPDSPQQPQTPPSQLPGAAPDAPIAPQQNTSTIAQATQVAANKKQTPIWLVYLLAIVSVVGFVVALLMQYVVPLFALVGALAVGLGLRMQPRPIPAIVIGSIGTLLSLGFYTFVVFA